MRVLVTGHEGYIGSELVPALRAAGYHVTGLDAGYYRACTLSSRPLQGTAPASLDQDLRDVSEADLTGFDAVVHLAALCNDPLGDLNPEWTHDVNHTGSVRLASLAKSAGVSRFVFASSCSVYGDAGSDVELTESTEPRPLTPYAVSKARSEEQIAGLADSSFSPVYLRNGSVYGLSPRFRADIVLNNLVCWALTTGAVTMLTDGSPWRPMVHVEDVCAAFVTALAAPRAAVHNQVFNIGSPGENYQVATLAELVRQGVDGSRLARVSHAGGDTRDYRVSFAKIGAALPQFKARWTVSDGVRQLVDGLRDARVTYDEFQGPRFTRLARLRELIDAGELDATLRRLVPAGRGTA